MSARHCIKPHKIISLTLQNPEISTVHFSSVQFSRSVVSTLCDPVDCSMSGFPVHHHYQSLLKLISIESVMPPNHLIPCRPLLLRPSIFHSLRLFSNEFFASGGQSIGASASAFVRPVNFQDWFPLGLTGLISLQSKGLSRVFSNTTVQEHQFFSTVFFMVQLLHPYMTTEKTIALTRQMDLCWQ